MTSYYEKLRDPRWQKRRLQIMERAEFACEECEDSKSTLNVHHRIYHKGRDPWDYSDRELACLCERCHELWHSLKDYVSELFVDLNISEIREMAGAGLAIALRDEKIQAVMPSSTAAMKGFTAIFGITEEQVSQLADESGWVSGDAIRNIAK